MALFPHFPLLFLILTARYATSQPSNNYNNNNTAGPNYSTNLNAATAILIVVIISSFFFLAFFSVYFHRCCRARDLSPSAIVPTAADAVTASRRGIRRGLDPAVLDTFPTLSYSAAALLKLSAESLECAVCLSEFGDDETLRMLPKCCHVFHPVCIDMWLESHVTCPVCRADLQLQQGRADVGVEVVGPTSTEECPEIEDEGVFVEIDLDRMGRSHSTGHVRGGGDRYTLRLPEHVRREMVEEAAVAGSLRRSATVAVYGGRGRSLRLSERWTAGILSRVSTWRRGEQAEGSARFGMFNCMTGGGGESSNSDAGVAGKV